jgi:hypothetical protein
VNGRPGEAGHALWRFAGPSPRSRPIRVTVVAAARVELVPAGAALIRAKLQALLADRPRYSAVPRGRSAGPKIPYAMFSWERTRRYAYVFCQMGTSANIALLVRRSQHSNPTTIGFAKHRHQSGDLHCPSATGPSLSGSSYENTFPLFLFATSQVPWTSKATHR